MQKTISILTGVAAVICAGFMATGMSSAPRPLKKQDPGECVASFGVESGQGQWGSNGWSFSSMLPFAGRTTNHWRTGSGPNDTRYSVSIPIRVSEKHVKGLSVGLFLSANGYPPSIPARIGLYRVSGIGSAQLIAETFADREGWQYESLDLDFRGDPRSHYFVRVEEASDYAEHTISVVAGEVSVYYACP